MPTSKEELLGMTSDIVSAYVSNNAVSINDLHVAIVKVHGALEALSNPPTKEPETPVYTPAVTARQSVKPDTVTCMECGWSGKMLKRHLQTNHGLSADEYRTKYRLPKDHPLVAPNYAAKRAQLAKDIGLGRKPNKPVRKAK